MIVETRRISIERHDPALLFPATAHQKKAVNKKDRVICGVLLNRDAPLPSRHGWLQLVFVPAELLRAYGPFPTAVRVYPKRSI